ELPRHAGDIPAQKLAADERRDLGQLHTGADEGRVTVAHVFEIFLEVPNDLATAIQRRQNIDKAEQLHFEMLVAHRESHHALIKAGLAEERFRMLIDKPENLFAASFHFRLKRIHRKGKFTRQFAVGKGNNGLIVSQARFLVRARNWD